MARWFPWRKKEAIPEQSAPTASVPSPGMRPCGPLQDGSFDSAQDKPSATLVRQASWRRGLSRLRRAFSAPLDRLLRGRPLNDEVFTELEEALPDADVGVPTGANLIA